MYVTGGRKVITHIFKDGTKTKDLIGKRVPADKVQKIIEMALEAKKEKEKKENG